jgi:hypothetical protein
MPLDKLIKRFLVLVINMSAAGEVLSLRSELYIFSWRMYSRLRRFL